MKNFIVVDGFYKNPWAVRQLALTTEYFKPDELPSDFAGTESRTSFTHDGIVKKIESIVGGKIEFNPRRFSFGVFCKTFAHDERHRGVHVDESDWTGVVYLSRPENCRGGTSIYRHIDSGLDRVPEAAALQERGYRDRREFIDRFVTPQGRDPSRWEVSMRAGSVFNRLVLFRAGQLFHASEGYYGTSDDDCRLTQLFFFKMQKVER